MTSHLWGPFQPLPGCRLWLSEDHDGLHASEPERYRELAEAHLCDQDMERWSRYRAPEKKRQFLSSRLAIRAVLQREFGTASDRYRVETLETGQPILKHQDQDILASISLSHTGNITAIAVTNSRRMLGVDIEIVKPFDVRTLSGTFLNQLELDWLTKEALTEDARMILAIWTVKEALWKALGGSSHTSISEIVTDYHDSTLNGHRLTNKGRKQPAVTHFFGHQLSFPFALTNYSSIDYLGWKSPSFVGCIVSMDRDSQIHQ